MSLHLPAGGTGTGCSYTLQNPGKRFLCFVSLPSVSGSTGTFAPVLIHLRVCMQSFRKRKEMVGGASADHRTHIDRKWSRFSASTGGAGRLLPRMGLEEQAHCRSFFRCKGYLWGWCMGKCAFIAHTGQSIDNGKHDSLILRSAGNGGGNASYVNHTGSL